MIKSFIIAKLLGWFILAIVVYIFALVNGLSFGLIGLHLSVAVFGETWLAVVSMLVLLFGSGYILDLGA